VPATIASPDAQPPTPTIPLPLASADTTTASTEKPVVVAPPTVTDIPLTPLSAPADPNAGAGLSRATSRQLDALITAALTLLGTQYRLGGESPAFGFDCSGFVHYLFDQQQIDMPRTVAEQFLIGRRIDLKDLQKGDLLFFSTTAKGPTHVGIALGPTSAPEFVHAPGAGGAVRVERFDTSYWRPRLIGIRRVF
jgi:cell wall-associated NlpC family hydrolase